jgi:hypothetical protein
MIRRRGPPANGGVRDFFLAANRFELRGKMRQAPPRVNVFKKPLNQPAGACDQ